MNEKMQEIMYFNRDTLEKIAYWLPRNAAHQVTNNYALPLIVEKHIDTYIGDELTYSDLVNYLSLYLNKKIQFLELGVSVGKNFFQVCNFVKDAKLTGLDFLKINPILENQMRKKEPLYEWECFKKPTKFYSPKRLEKKYQCKNQWIIDKCLGIIPTHHQHFSITKYQYHTNEVYYVNSDLFDQNAWSFLSKLDMKFNLIFSDAYHLSEAVLLEYELLHYFDLLDTQEFVMLWDDLNVVKPAFNKIWHDLSNKFPNELIKFEIPIRGWIGNNEKEFHYVGVILKIKDKSKFLSQLK